VGYPQLSAVIEGADAAHGMGGHICADGGCEVPGDIAKAFGGGADFVMLGGLLSGHKESEAKPFSKKGGKFLKFYGSSSEDAMRKHNGGTSVYRANEGKTVEVPYRGPVEKTAQEILGGLRSVCTYIGASSLKEVPKRTTFVRVNHQLSSYFKE
jgi:GMP reductase